MARKLKEGTVPRRIRLKLPGWRDGAFDLRPGRAGKTVYRRWRDLIQSAHREGYYDVLDALQDGDLSMAHAYKLSRSTGVQGIRRHLQEIEEEAAERAVQGNFVTWLNDFLEVMPRPASATHHERIAGHVRSFLKFIADRHSLDRREDVTLDLWSEENLEAYVAHYIARNHAAARARLEEAWAEMERPLEEVERADEFRKDEGRKRVTANRHVNSIGAFSQWLIERGRIKVDPCPGVRISTTQEAKHREDSHRSLTPSQLKGFLRWSREFDRLNPSTRERKPDTLYWEMLVATGARTYTEGSRIRPADVKSSESRDGATPLEIRASKGSGKTRSVYVIDALANRLLERATETGIGRRRALFPFSEGKARGVWDGVMRLIAERAPELYEELEGATPYCLRHTFAVAALKTGVDIYTLKQLMGHENITTTEIYLKHVDAPFKRLAAMGRTLGLDSTGK